MTTLSIMPLEITIRELIAEGGFLRSWTDYNGNVQLPPKVQLYELDEESNSVRENELLMVIKNSGNGSGNYLVREPAMSIIVFSDTLREKMSLAKHYAETIKNHLSINFRKDCIMSVNIIGDVAGPYRLQSGRRYFELNLQVITTTGVA